MRLPGASWPATQSASRLARVPLEVRWPRYRLGFGPAEHGGDLADRLDLHLRAGAAAVPGVVVGIDVHGQRIGRARQRMRRLEHLPGIERMEVGIVVSQPMGHGGQNLAPSLPVSIIRCERRAKPQTPLPAAQWRGTRGRGQDREAWRPPTVSQPEAWACGSLSPNW